MSEGDLVAYGLATVFLAGIVVGWIVRDLMSPLARGIGGRR